MDKKSFSDYKAEDFITDESFINYHLDDNSADGLMWKEWILHHPEKADVIAEAKKPSVRLGKITPIVNVLPC